MHVFDSWLGRGRFEASFLTPTELSANVQGLFSSCRNLVPVRISGQVVNLHGTDRGHVFFSLTDGRCTLACAYFRTRQTSGVRLENGLQVVVQGNLAVHPRKSIFQIQVERVWSEGVGSLSVSVAALKDRLEREGLFDPLVKKPLPFRPVSVGLLAASGSDGERDVLTVLQHEAPDLLVRKARVCMAGPDAVPSIIHGLSVLSRDSVDVIIVARGGGPDEDLAVFNDERVVRAISKCMVPVVTGIGHESDVTLSDFAADVSAITPTAAAFEVCRSGRSEGRPAIVVPNWFWFFVLFFATVFLVLLVFVFIVGR